MKPLLCALPDSPLVSQQDRFFQIFAPLVRLFVFHECYSQAAAISAGSASKVPGSIDGRIFVTEYLLSRRRADIDSLEFQQAASRRVS